MRRGWDLSLCYWAVSKGWCDARLHPTRLPLPPATCAGSSRSRRWPPESYTAPRSQCGAGLRAEGLELLGWKMHHFPSQGWNQIKIKYVFIYQGTLSLSNSRGDTPCLGIHLKATTAVNRRHFVLQIRTETKGTWCPASTAISKFEHLLFSNNTGAGLRPTDLEVLSSLRRSMILWNVMKTPGADDRPECLSHWSTLPHPCLLVWPQRNSLQNIQLWELRNKMALSTVFCPCERETFLSTHSLCAALPDMLM